DRERRRRGGACGGPVGRGGRGRGGGPDAHPRDGHRHRAVYRGEARPEHGARAHRAERARRRDLCLRPRPQGRQPHVAGLVRPAPGVPAQDGGPLLARPDRRRGRRQQEVREVPAAREDAHRDRSGRDAERSWDRRSRPRLRTGTPR
ncbi:MAG: Polyphosphate glucokinase, partial [uncultured Rubrobacteraceae bacterium]